MEQPKVSATPWLEADRAAASYGARLARFAAQTEANRDEDIAQTAARRTRANAEADAQQIVSAAQADVYRAAALNAADAALLAAGNYQPRLPQKIPKAAGYAPSASIATEQPDPFLAPAGDATYAAFLPRLCQLAAPSADAYPNLAPWSGGTMYWDLAGRTQKRSIRRNLGEPRVRRNVSDRKEYGFLFSIRVFPCVPSTVPDSCRIPNGQPE